MNTLPLVTMAEVSDLFVDAVVVDNRNRLIFLSAWGQDTTLQSFVARLSLPPSQDGLSTFTLHGQDYYQSVEIPNANDLRKHTGRTPKTCLFQGLSQLWLYDTLTMEVDRLKRRCLLICHPAESKQDIFWRVWQAVRELCHVPLLSEWHTVIKHFRDRDWVQFFKGRGVNAVYIDLSSLEVEAVISQLVRGGHLSLLTLSKEPDFAMAQTA